MNEKPLVTINILSYNRKEELRHTLAKVYEQDYKNIEVIVVDNASSDGTPEMVETEFPKVILIKLNKNIGIAGYNKMFEVAKGEYILLLDDDSYPENTSITEGLKVLLRNNEIGIIAYRIFNKRFNQFENDLGDEQEVIDFIACGVMIRKSCLIKTEYFDSNYFIYHNEIDLSIRFREKGYKIFYLKEQKIIHRQIDLARKGKNKNPNTSRTKYYHNFVGRGIFLLKYFSLKYIIISGWRLLINRLFIAVFYGYILTYFKSVLRLIILFPRVIRKRKKVKPEIQRLYNYGKLNFIDRTFFSNYKNNTNI